MAKRFAAVGIRGKDALHLSCAVSAKCEYFLTTDDEIIRKARSLNEITTLTPPAFLSEVSL